MYALIAVTGIVGWSLNAVLAGVERRVLHSHATVKRTGSRRDPEGARPQRRAGRPARLVALWWTWSAGAGSFYFPPLSDIPHHLRADVRFEYWAVTRRPA